MNKNKLLILICCLLINCQSSKELPIVNDNKNIEKTEEIESKSNEIIVINEESIPKESENSEKEVLNDAEHSNEKAEELETYIPKFDEETIKNNYELVSLDSLYWDLPEVFKCQYGSLKETEKVKVLNKLNYIRFLHKLKPVEYFAEDDVLTAKSSLLMTAHAKVGHYTNSDWECYSEQGSKGSLTSNLSGTYYDREREDERVRDTRDIMIELLIDEGKENLGHRRWFLDPFLKYISLGRVDGVPIKQRKTINFFSSVSIKVVNEEIQDISDTDLEFVAYPFENYPELLMKKDWLFSFTLIKDKKVFRNNEFVDFSKAKIEVISEDEGKSLFVNSIGFDNEYFGVQNILRWKVQGLEKDKKYFIKINDVEIFEKKSGIEFFREKKSYSYWVKLV